MTNPITIESVGLEGFRAYLQHQSFPFSRGTTPLSLAVFAPNAKGKSSLVDAFEYYFSEDATLSRLGIRAVDRRAGRSALEHVDAKANDITPGVRISFRQGTDRFEDRRPVMPQGAPLTDAGRRVLEHTVLPFIIRGHELRGFVENQTSEQRYEEIVGWFGLAPLLEIQKNLRALRRQVKNQSESTAQRDERLRDLSRITSGNLTQWDDTTVCHWFNDEVLAKLDKELRLQSPSRADRGYQELTARKQAEDERVGLTSLKQILGHIETVHQFRKEDDQKPSGTIPAFENAVITYNEAKQREEQERAKAAETVFKETWEKAKALFENDGLPTVS